jgi:hypothetical protein
MSQLKHKPTCTFEKDMAKWNKLQEDFENLWPGYCKKCGAHGVCCSSENVAGFGEPAIMMDNSDPCSCIDDGFCPRCGVDLVFESQEQEEKFYEDTEPCPNCGWKWGLNDGDCLPDPPDGPCECDEVDIDKIIEDGEVALAMYDAQKVWYNCDSSYDY